MDLDLEALASLARVEDLVTDLDLEALATMDLEALASLARVEEDLVTTDLDLDLATPRPARYPQASTVTPTTTRVTMDPLPSQERVLVETTVDTTVETMDIAAPFNKKSQLLKETYEGERSKHLPSSSLTVPSFRAFHHITHTHTSFYGHLLTHPTHTRVIRMIMRT